jgi:hypothetical protein
MLFLAVFMFVFYGFCGGFLVLLMVPWFSVFFCWFRILFRFCFFTDFELCFDSKFVQIQKKFPYKLFEFNFVYIRNLFKFEKCLNLDFVDMHNLFN